MPSPAVRFSAVHVDHVAGEPVRTGLSERHQRTSHVFGTCQPMRRVLADRDLAHGVAVRDLLEGRRVGHAGTDGVGGDPNRRELEGELAHVGLERRLRRADHAVAAPHLSRTGAGHGEDTPVFAQQLALEQILDPVHQTVSHDVVGHVHLLLVHGVLTHQRLERPEGERVQEHAQLLVLLTLGEALDDVVQHLRASLLVGGVDVVEPRLTPHLAQPGDQPFDLRHGRTSVQVNSDDVHAGLGEREGRGFAEAAGGPENQRPAVERGKRYILAVGHRRACLLQALGQGRGLSLPKAPFLSGGLRWRQRLGQLRRLVSDEACDFAHGHPGRAAPLLILQDLGGHVGERDLERLGSPAYCGKRRASAA